MLMTCHKKSSSPLDKILYYDYSVYFLPYQYDVRLPYFGALKIKSRKSRKTWMIISEKFQNEISYGQMPKVLRNWDLSTIQPHDVGPSSSSKNLKWPINLKELFVYLGVILSRGLGHSQIKASLGIIPCLHMQAYLYLSHCRSVAHYGLGLGYMLYILFQWYEVKVKD